MSRYDWPSQVTEGDDPGGRVGHLHRFVPVPDVRLDDGTIPPVGPDPTPRSRRRPTPRAAPSGGTNLWLPIGPSTVAHGQATNAPNVSGRVRDLAVHPGTGDRIYAGTGAGGVWFSSDRGASWIPLDEFVESPNRSTLFPVGNALSVGSIHVAWGAATSGADDVVTVGTGEPGGAAGLSGLPGGRVLGIGMLEATGPGTGTPWTRPAGADPLRGHVVTRIVENPLDATHLLASTSRGVFSKQGAGPWTQVPGTAAASDIAVTRLNANTVRVWLASFSASITMHTMPHPYAGGAIGAATAVALANATGGRKALAVGAGNDLWVQGQNLTPPPKGQEVACGALWRVDTSVAAPANIPEITGIPTALFGKTGGAQGQSWYDNTLVVHPDNANVLFLGGSAVYTDQWNASLYRITVAGTVATPVWIGKGVHSDVHAIEVGGPTLAPDTDRTVFVGCDGGVFFSGADGRADSFVSRNNALSTLEPGWVAGHPTNDGIVTAGMQDNGTCTRLGDTVWGEPFMGDGGGVVYDPAHANRYFRQYTRALWHSSDGGSIQPVMRRGAEASTGRTTSEAFESGQALFYSGASAVAHGGTTHLALGSNRPWYSDDWGRSWVTVPSGRDPRASKTADLALDVVDPGVVTGQFADNVPTFLCCTGEFTGAQVPGSGIACCRLSAMTDDGSDHRIRLAVMWERGIRQYVGRRAAATPSAKWTWTTEHTFTIRNALAGPETTALTNGTGFSFLPAPGLISDLAVHDANAGPLGSFYVSTIGSGVPATVDTLWWFNGTDRFIPCGVRHALARGTWTVPADRIVSPALAVAVDTVDPNVVFVGTSVGVIRGTMTPGANPTWDWARFDNGLPEAAVQDLSVFAHDGVHLLRGALQARGVWETDLGTPLQTPQTYLRIHPTDTRRRTPTPLTGPPTNGATGLRYDSSPDLVFDTTAITYPGGATEEDLIEPRAPTGVGPFVAQEFTGSSFRAHVLVHHRWFQPTTAAGVRVALLKHPMPADGSDVPLGAIWNELVAIAGGGAVPGVLPSGWERAGDTMVRAAPGPVSVRRPRAVTFDVNVAGMEDGERVMFLAVVMSDTDQITAAEAAGATTVRELVLNSRHAAARSFRHLV